jgi:hypothetical protein
MSINERLNIIINELFSGNKRAFAKKIGVAATVIENIVGKRMGKPSYDVLEKICVNANISTEWLIRGKGDMIFKEKEVPVAIVDPNNPFMMNLLNRVEALAVENAKLKGEIEDIKKQKKYRDLCVPDIAAEPELIISKPVKNEMHNKK